MQQEIWEIQSTKDKHDVVYGVILVGDLLVEYLPSFITCSLDVLWALINLFKVSPKFEIFLSFAIYFLLNSWLVHWARDTDDIRQTLALLKGALEIIRGYRRRYNSQVSKLGFRHHCNVLLSTKQYLKTKLV